ncbi:MAG TPA: YidC/Oxa1 family membrane protein insertase [Anaerolineaceae bacterium]
MWQAFISFMINVLLFIYNLVGNFGVAIILFTLLIRLVTHPLTVSQLKGTTAMQKLNENKEWQEIQKKYKDDKEKLSQEQMRLYKELGINPFASCLPTLIQFPIIIGLYQAIIQSLAVTPLELLRLTTHVFPGFLDVSKLIPLNSQFLWMNLGQPDSVRIAGLPFGIPVLAVIVVITTYVQSKLMTPASTGGNDQSNQMMGMMNIYMPFLMGYLAYTLASGLSLYFIASNLIGIAQYAMLGRVNWSNLLPRRKAPVEASGVKTGTIKPSGKPSAKPPLKK